jgi:hypothetical protein
VLYGASSRRPCRAAGRAIQHLIVPPPLTGRGRCSRDRRRGRKGEGGCPARRLAGRGLTAGQRLAWPATGR